MLELSYDVDEIFALFPKWLHAGSPRRQDAVIADYTDDRFDRSTEDGADDWATLVCAMKTLYETLERQLRRSNVRVCHCVYVEEYEYLEFILGK